MLANTAIHLAGYLLHRMTPQKTQLDHPRQTWIGFSESTKHLMKSAEIRDRILGRLGFFEGYLCPIEPAFNGVTFARAVVPLDSG